MIVNVEIMLYRLQIFGRVHSKTYIWLKSHLVQLILPDNHERFSRRWICIAAEMSGIYLHCLHYPGGTPALSQHGLLVQNSVDFNSSLNYE